MLIPYGEIKIVLELFSTIVEPLRGS